VRKKRCRGRACSARVLTVAFVMSLAAVAAGQAPARARILGISHVTFFVHDVAAARNYYQNLLGYAHPVEVRGKDGSSLMTVVRINDRQYVELVPERAAGSDRLATIAVQTDDAEAMRVYLKSRGIAVPDKVGSDRLENISFDVTDPDGHVVSIVQYKPNGWMTVATGTVSNERAISTDMRHAGILVGALEPAMAFYRDVLGFKDIWRGSRDEKELNWVNMQVPDGEDYIEFMLYQDLPEPSKRGTQHHICLFVPDIEKSLAALRERASSTGYTRAMEIRTGTNRKRQLNLYDPDGTRVELMEPNTIDGKPAPSSAAPPPRR
jgi:catechol 2,3-dioxygenase-like lactoylglutathione lyase family enzyme